VRARLSAGVHAGASVDERDALGYTALMLAVRCHNNDEAAVLLDDGHASTTLRDDEHHRTAVDWAELPSVSTPAYRQRRTSRSLAAAVVFEIWAGALRILPSHRLDSSHDLFESLLVFT